MKEIILTRLAYTELVYERINKKLQLQFSNVEIESMIRVLIEKTTIENILIKGKNYYICNLEDRIRVTIDSNTYRVITVDRI